MPLITELSRRRVFWETRRQPDTSNPLDVVNLPSVEPYGARLRSQYVAVLDKHAPRERRVSQNLTAPALSFARSRIPMQNQPESHREFV